MTVQYKTPGVYVEEIDAFPPSIVGVDTAVPVFIGYTQKAEKNGRNLKLQPVRIGSMVEYAAIFGHAFEPQFKVTDSDAVLTQAKTDAAKTGGPLTTAKAADTAAKQAVAAAATGTDEKAKTDAKKTARDAAAALRLATNADTDAKNKVRAAQSGAADFAIGGSRYTLDIGDKVYLLYNSLRLFYANGGGNCYIVSVGDNKAAIAKLDFENGLAAVRDLVGPTMLVIPEAVLLGREDYKTVVYDMLTQCQTKQDRVAILDVWGTDRLPPDLTESEFGDAMTTFREGLSAVPGAALKYGMVYAPFVKTSVIDPSEFDYTNFAEFGPDPGTGHWQPGALTSALLNAANALYPDPAGTPPVTTKPDWWPATPAFPADLALSAKAREIGALYIGKMKDAQDLEGADRDAAIKKINQGLTAQLPVLQDIYAAMAAKLGVLPPSAAMAGVYTRNDADRGVWNAPANVGLVSVIGPTLQISNTMQGNLNMPIDGLAINAIRDFVGRGTLVWGARTLDGNSNDWRYIQVRRALIYIEQSVELALNKFVFEPNVAQTWVTVTSMIGSFLRGVWQAGGLMGASPAEAFTVQCGLGSTMTAQDILLGTMNVQIMLQMVHPAEFIVLTFKQQMQGGA
jgi:phage tail sheath protein FI